MSITYRDFDLRIRGNAESGYSVEASALNGGGSVPPETLILPRDGMFALGLDSILQRITSAENMRSIGTALFKALFPEQVLTLWERARGRLKDGEGLRIRLRIGPLELKGLPWELVFEEEFIGLRVRFPIVRYLDLPDPPLPVSVEPPLRVLVAVSQPKDTQPLNVDAELNSIHEALSGLEGRVEMELLSPARREDLLSMLRRGYHVLHYIGHGKVKDGEGYLVLEGTAQVSDPVEASLLGQMVTDSRLRLVVLNACDTSMVGLKNAFSCVAHQLVRAGIPAVVAMQLTIRDQSAIAFSRGVYGALADGWPIDAAVQEGRRSIMTELGSAWDECADWAVPALYMRAPDGVILRVQGEITDTDIRETAAIRVEVAGQLIETCFVPAGDFLMGSDPRDHEAFDNEKPGHGVYLSAYEIGKYPVTNAQYSIFVQATGYPAPMHWAGTRVPPGKENHPVVNVSLDDALAFCRWLTETTGQRYCLPKEAEWEKAARGAFPDRRRYPWGDEWVDGAANTKEAGYGDTTPVDAFEEMNKSPFRVVDMAGNVWEWTRSWYDKYPGSTYSSPNLGRIFRVVRGGSYYMHNDYSNARVSCRGRYKPSAKRRYLGFRIVRVIAEEG